MKKALPTLAMLAAALAATGICLAGAKPGAKVYLKQKWVPGSYVQTVSRQIDLVSDLGGREMPVEMSQESTFAVEISKPDKTGNKTMTWRYKRVKQTVVVPGRIASYDSAAPETGDPNLASTLGGMCKAKITLIIGPDEKIKAVTGLDEMWDEMAKKNPAAAAMKKSMGNKMIKDMAKKFGQYLPGNPVAIGSQWVKKSDLGVPILGGKVKAEIKCELKSIEAAVGGGKRAVISMTGKLEATKPQLAAIRVGGTTVRKLVITMTGENKLNVDNPMLSEMTLVQDGSMEIQMEGHQVPAVKSKFKNKMVIRVVKAPSPKDKPGK